MRRLCALVALLALAPVASFGAAGAPATLVRVDATALPADTGWFAVPITTTQATTLRFEYYGEYHGGNEASAFRAFVRTPWATGAIGGGGGDSAAHRFLSISAHGIALDCCASSGGGGGPGVGRSWATWAVGADQTFWVGVVAVGWDERNVVNFTFEADAAALVVGTPRTGLDVTLHDLGALAHREGTGVRVQDELVAGEYGAGRVAWTAPGKGFVSIAAWADSEGAQGRLSASAFGHQLFVEEDIHQKWLFASAQGSGEVEVTLEGFADGGDGQPWPFPGDGRLVEVTALVADLDVPGEGGWTDVVDWS